MNCNFLCLLTIDPKYKGYISFGHLISPIDLTPDPCLVSDIKSKWKLN